MGQQFGVMQTLYESREKKGIKLEFNAEAANEIETYLTTLEEMTEAYKDNSDIIRGLNDLKAKAKACLISHLDEKEIIESIRKLTSIEGPGGKKIDIKSFHEAKSQQIADVDVFKQRTIKRINQTIKNGISLLQWDANNKDLEGFLKDMKQIDLNLSGQDLDKKVKELIKSGGFDIYQKVKERFIKEWLLPFQEELGKPIESLSQDEMQEAMKRMKIVMSQRMKEGDLIIHPESDKFKEFNQSDHDMVNGNDKTFWLNDPLVDEFIAMTQAVLTRFTFLLDKQFLVFQFKSEPYLYLIGFSSEAFSSAEQSKDGTLLIAPHVKAIIQGKDGSYRELNKSKFDSVGLYTDVLKDTLKPFFKALSEKIQFDLSKDFQRHFRM